LTLIHAGATTPLGRLPSGVRNRFSGTCPQLACPSPKATTTNATMPDFFMTIFPQSSHPRRISHTAAECSTAQLHVLFTHDFLTSRSGQLLPGARRAPTHP